MTQVTGKKSEAQINVGTSPGDEQVASLGREPDNLAAGCPPRLSFRSVTCRTPPHGHLPSEPSTARALTVTRVSPPHPLPSRRRPGTRPFAGNQEGQNERSKK